MAEMRKVQQSGHSLVISIPKKWVDELDIELHDYLKLEKKGDKITLEANEK